MAGTNNAAACASCTRRRPIVKGEGQCNKLAIKIEGIRVGCCPAEIISPSDDLGCTGYVSNIVVDPLIDPTPLVCVDVYNEDDIRETNDFAFDFATELGTDSYTFGPVKVKVYDPDQECTLRSWKGQEMCIYYKMTNATGEYVWRRVKMTLTLVAGNLQDGFELTFTTPENPSQEDAPMFVLIGATAATTEAALDAITVFAP